MVHLRLFLTVFDPTSFLCSLLSVCCNQTGTPRSTSTCLPAVNFLNQPISVSFEVTAFPVPTTTFTFSYLGANGTDSPSDTEGIQLSATCQLRGDVEYISTCTLTVHNVTSAQAAGFYTVRVSNGHGSEDYKFQVMINGE